ncbi:hypothetical protein TIMEGRIFFIN_22 [Bacillus phage vB_BspH_TimeGriffin]|nr:hypothetical protein TIMEGRIFFIN_22 [Bacillus phage vB_BspH_TimeGriffin]
MKILEYWIKDALEVGTQAEESVEREQGALM